MQKQKKQFIIAIILVIVLVVVFFILQTFNKHQEEKEAEQKEAETITALTVSKDKISSFAYQHDGKEISFEKKDDTWYLASDHETAISQSLIATMLSNVETISADQQITGVKDTGEYGFKEPLNVITLQIGDTTDSRNTITITIGMHNEITNQYYMTISGSDNVYLVKNSIYTAFKKSVEDLTETKEDTEETKEDS